MFELLLERFKKRLPDTLLTFEKRPQNIGSTFNEAHKAIGYALALGKDKEEVVNLLDIANQLGKATFVSSGELDFNFKLDWNGTIYPFKKQKSSAYSDVMTWEIAYYFSIILRDKEGIDLLRSVSLAQLDNANIKPDEFDYAAIAFFKGLYDDSVDLGELLIDAMEASDIETFSKERRDYVLNIKVPELSLYRCIFSNAPIEFNEKLAEALEDHKTYWSTSNNAMDVKGWISWIITAACVVAYGSKNYPVEVQSDYFPEWLVKGEF